MQIYVIETNYFPMLPLHGDVISYTTVVVNTVHCFFPSRKDVLERKTIVLYSPRHGELEFLNSVFLIFVGTLLYVWLHILLCVALVMDIILLRVAVDRVASAALVAVESGN